MLWAQCLLFPKGSILFLETLPQVYFSPPLYLPLNSNTGNAIFKHFTNFKCCFFEMYQLAVYFLDFRRFLNKKTDIYMWSGKCSKLFQLWLTLCDYEL